MDSLPTKRLREILTEAHKTAGVDNSAGAAVSTIDNTKYRAGTEWGGGLTLRITRETPELRCIDSFEEFPDGGWRCHRYEYRPEDGFSKHSELTVNAEILEELVETLTGLNWRDEIYEHIDALINEWHQSTGEESLPDFLRWNETEYRAFVENNKFPPTPLRRRININF